VNEKRKKKERLSQEELERQEGKPLPDREVMSLLPIGDPAGPGFVSIDGLPDVESQPDPGPEDTPKGG
jgi:hypothetical protein